MGGIAGLVSSQASSLRERRVDSALVAELSRRLKHRGPDDEGYLSFGQHGVELSRQPITTTAAPEVVLLNRRLSIIDLTDAGWQPMGTPDGRYYITFNGQIYNYVELRRELAALGRRFRSNSDTEVLLNAYACWGLAALPRLEGMFAFAILDTRERKLVLARDFFGIKPLYYCYPCVHHLPRQDARRHRRRRTPERPGPPGRSRRRSSGQSRTSLLVPTSWDRGPRR